MKRKRAPRRDPGVNKRQKIEGRSIDPLAWPILRQYYTEVVTLRQYLASKHTRLSKKRRRAILRYGNEGDDEASSNLLVSSLLDNVAVGTFNHVGASSTDDIDKDISIFTQQLSANSSISPTQGAFKQSEVGTSFHTSFYAHAKDTSALSVLGMLIPHQIVDFVLWKLFRTSTGPFAPPHMLCRGYQKYISNATAEDDLTTVAGVPGIFCHTVNPHVKALKEHPWSALPFFIGNGAERVLTDLFMYCGVFAPVKNGTNLNQISGIPLSDLRQLPKITARPIQAPAEIDLDTGTIQATPTPSRGLSEIRFVRYRMLHAGPNLTAKGSVCFGLPQHHVLNRVEEANVSSKEEHMLRYIFPRQFGLHNAFTSVVDRKDTSQPFKDYTDREHEISHALYEWKAKRRKYKDTPDDARPSLPKRLRGTISSIVGRIVKRHHRCAYRLLLHHYCPKQAAHPENTIHQASTRAQVSAFCRSVVANVFPSELFGVPAVRTYNQRCIMRNIDRFIRLGRYETISLHDVLQDIRVEGVEWLNALNSKMGDSMSAADFTKRRELLAELLYFLFDSFLIPLIRGHFHVTESGAHRNQLFYFRHDVWKALSDPALSSLKERVLEPCQGRHVKATLARRALGVSSIRLLPKEKGMRPIINLRRRLPRIQNGQLVLGKSINSILAPAFSVLNYEKSANHGLLASAMFSVEDIYPRLQAFRQQLEKTGLFGKPLFFAKVDVKACFDTIPQRRLMQVAQDIIKSEQYRVTRYARGKLVGYSEQAGPDFGAKPSWRYFTKATASDKDFDFMSEVKDDIDDGRTRSVYIDGVVQKTDKRQGILRLLEEHIESNLIRLGNKFYRQKQGIPQGSIVSSLLCSYFYADLERKLLTFVDDDRSILLRLIDDFLVIATQQNVAEMFLQTMHAGIPEYGVEVKGEKSRANFDVVCNGTSIPRLPEVTDFPYCGLAINTVDLNLSKDMERRKKSNLPDSMTIEYSRLPGQSFYRKTLSALKLQLQPMLLSTSYNSVSTVLSNLHHCFTEVALKCYYYIHSLPAAKQPSGKLVIRTVDEMIKLACILMKRRKRSRKDTIPYHCNVNNAQARWLACTAFETVFRRRQTKHGELLGWAGRQRRRLGLKGGVMRVIQQ